MAEEGKIVEVTARVKISTRVLGKLSLEARFEERIMDRFRRVV